MPEADNTENNETNPQNKRLHVNRLSRAVSSVTQSNYLLFGVFLAVERALTERFRAPPFEILASSATISRHSSRVRFSWA